MKRGLIVYRGPSVLDGAPIVAVVTFDSSNTKTGPMAQAWVIRSDQSPMDAIRAGADASICGNCIHRSGSEIGRSCYVVPWHAPTNIWKSLQAGQYDEPELSAAARLCAGELLRIAAYGDPAAVPFRVWRTLLLHAAGGTGYCVVPETKVLTADLRWVAAGDVRVGDALMAFDEMPTSHCRWWREATVTAADRVVRPCYRIQLRDGTTLTASEDHPWLVKHRSGQVWKRTDMLRAGGQRPTRILKLINRWEPTASWDAGYLAAAFDGEGWMGGRGPNRPGLMGQLGFTQKDNAMASTVQAALGSLGFSFSKYATRVPSYNVNGGVREVMRFLGQLRPQRLLAKFQPERCGRLMALDYVAVDSIERVGEREVAGLTTTTGTFVAEGFASHNTHQWKTCDQRFQSFCMASVESDVEADEARRLGWRFFRARLATEVLRADEIVCPASDEAGHRVTCAQCILCAGTARGRARSIAIVVHGQRTTWLKQQKDLVSAS